MTITNVKESHFKLWRDEEIEPKTITGDLNKATGYLVDIDKMFPNLDARVVTQEVHGEKEYAVAHRVQPRASLAA
jgi:hypothetical protein